MAKPKPRRRYNLNVQRSDTDQRWTQCKACRLRSLSPMCEATYDVLDVEVPTGSDRARIDRLCYAYLRAGPMSGDTASKGFRIVYETLAEMYPSTCPVLLLWRIRWQELTAALACPAIRRPPPQEGSRAHRAMAMGACLRWRGKRPKCSVCREVYAEIAGAAQTLRAAHEPAAWDRARQAAIYRAPDGWQSPLDAPLSPGDELSG